MDIFERGFGDLIRQLQPGGDCQSCSLRLRSNPEATDCRESQVRPVPAPPDKIPEASGDTDWLTSLLPNWEGVVSDIIGSVRII